MFYTSLMQDEASLSKWLKEEQGKHFSRRIWSIENQNKNGVCAGIAVVQEITHPVKNRIKGRTNSKQKDTILVINCKHVLHLTYAGRSILEQIIKSRARKRACRRP